LSTFSCSSRSTAIQPSTPPPLPLSSLGTGIPGSRACDCAKGRGLYAAHDAIPHGPDHGGGGPSCSCSSPSATFIFRSSSAHTHTHTHTHTHVCFLFDACLLLFHLLLYPLLHSITLFHPTRTHALPSSVTVCSLVSTAEPILVNLLVWPTHAHFMFTCNHIASQTRTHRHHTHTHTRKSKFLSQARTHQSRKHKHTDTHD